jgi:hypothetical protein
LFIFTLFTQVRIRSEHAVGYIKGRFQSLRGLQQLINSPRDYALALAWVRTCIIIHTLTAQYEEAGEEADFWEWVNDGLVNQPHEGDDCEPVSGFTWGNGEVAVLGESPGQRKRHHVQEALFAQIYV